MHHPEGLWKRFRRSARGRILAAALIAGSFGFFAATEVSQDPAVLACAAVGGALLGVLAVGILELRDRRRHRTAEWQQSVARTVVELRRDYPLIPEEHAPQIAQAVEEQREEQRASRHLSPIAWVGVILGGFCLLCGALMLIVRAVEFLRAW